MYAPHPIGINPFKTVLFYTFVNEREKAMKANGEGAGDGTETNEQLVWVLWKILKGDGNDVRALFDWLISGSDQVDDSTTDWTVFSKHPCQIPATTET
jgi:hypothetical protein